VSEEDKLTRQSMHDDYQAVHDAIWAAESTREQRAVAFQAPIEALAADVRRQVLDVRLIVQHEMLLDPATDVDEAQVATSLTPASLSLRVLCLCLPWPCLAACICAWSICVRDSSRRKEFVREVHTKGHGELHSFVQLH
jgi:hypothetical protein